MSRKIFKKLQIKPLLKRMHSFSLSVKDAIELQKKLCLKIKIEPLKKEPDMIAGCDCSYSKNRNLIFGAVVLVEKKSFKIVEKKVAIENVFFPYIPGLLSFREIPVLIKALKMLKNKPDLLIVDGAGIMHPRKFGIASHLGYLFNIPSIGCAKSYLIGEHLKPKFKKGSFEKVYYNAEEIGIILRTKEGVKPVYVSVGYKITIENAKEIILNLLRGYRLPEVVRLAHQLSKAQANI